ncbi:hypothetical protein OUZ56_015792 [Daphnia magna]|uniref:Uncharacterized protein n=1 Tax=Daphnia magna TaxID=35525 RepID=A0ABR0ANT6_9CRUS|nr:hypothetical protein OUZ56_015792 [Daphnia magna]
MTLPSTSSTSFLDVFEGQVQPVQLSLSTRQQPFHIRRKYGAPVCFLGSKLRLVQEDVKMGQVCGGESKQDYSITNVANAYSKTIWARVVGERKHVTLRNSPIGSTAGIDFTPIYPGDFQSFRLPSNQDPDDPVYITILTDDDLIMCNSVPQLENQSVIVDQNGILRNTMTGFIWRDTNGKDHDVEKSIDDYE